MRPDSDSLPNAALVRADVLELLREKRYEDALAMLYRARSESPDNGELQKSIDQIKEFLIGAYAKRLGGFDHVAKPIPLTAVRSPDAVLLSRYVDGTSTIGDIAQMSPLGQLRTLQVLVNLYATTAENGLERDPPPSGLRAPEALVAPGALFALNAPIPELPAESIWNTPTARLAPVESEDDRRYREAFALGTAAFVQHRYGDAVEAFEVCARLRPNEAAAAVMLRRSLRDLESR